MTFPINPTIGQQHTKGTQTYEWNGVAWDIAGSATADAIADKADITYVDNKPSGFKNYIINGGFDVWQRGTTVSTADYCSDRWMIWATNAGVANRKVSCKKQTGGPIGKNSSYLQASFAEVDTGAEKIAWGQKIEKQNLKHVASGQQLTLSFWIKKDQSLPTDNPLDIQILYPSSEDGWGAGYLFRGSYTSDQTVATISSFNGLSTSWTKYTYTFTPSDTALDRGFAIYWHIGDTNFGLDNTNSIFSFTGVQLEEGSVATPFEHRPYGLELSLCQRYYEKGFFYRSGVMVNTSAGLSSTEFCVEKRVIPAISIVPSSLMNFTGVAQITSYTNYFGHYPTGGTSNTQGRYSLSWTADAEL